MSGVNKWNIMYYFNIIKDFPRIIKMKILGLIIFFAISIGAHSEEMINRKHAPFASQQCLICHQKGPDGNPEKDKFTATQPDMCYKCHDRKDTNPIVHAALGMGDCTTCHSPHESSVRPLLKDTTENTCTMCHDAPGRELPVKHSALQMSKSCVRCHNAHSSTKPKLLRGEITQLCTYCHTGLKISLENSANLIHPALRMGCQSCHTPHGSNNQKLLKENVNELCFTCHEAKKFDGGHPRPGHPVSGRPDPMYPDKEFTCVSCHKPHLSVNKNLLRYNFKQKPYNGTICSVCHWSQILPPPAPPTPGWND
jgi:predicted CXXCH cytochrome family protein